MSSKTYTLSSIATLALTVGLLLSSAVSAQQDRFNPNNIQGYKNLYADLNGDGHIERVGLVHKKLDWGRQTWDQFQIVVFNDKGKTIWRSSPPGPNQRFIVDGTNINPECGNIKHCLLHDIDGDGKIELVFSGWESYVEPEDGMYSKPVDGFFYDLSAHPIYRWENNRFIKLNNNLRLSTTKDSNICKFDTSYCDYVSQYNHTPKYTETGRSLIHNLRKINGQIWGDIKTNNHNILPNFRTFNIPPDTFFTDIIDNPNLRHYDDDGNEYPVQNWYWYKIARLETCPGGMRIVEYKHNN